MRDCRRVVAAPLAPAPSALPHRTPPELELVGRVGGQGWWAGLVAGLVSMIDGSPALQARRHSRPDSMHCMQLAGSSSIRPRCRAYAAKRRHYQSPSENREARARLPGCGHCTVGPSRPFKQDSPGAWESAAAIPVRPPVPTAPGNASARSPCQNCQGMSYRAPSTGGRMCVWR